MVFIVRLNVVVWLGKIKCAAKALACVSACSSFNFAKRWHFCLSILAQMFDGCTVVIALQVTVGTCGVTLAG